MATPLPRIYPTIFTLHFILGCPFQLAFHRIYPDLYFSLHCVVSVPTSISPHIPVTRLFTPPPVFLPPEFLPPVFLPLNFYPNAYSQIALLFTLGKKSHFASNYDFLPPKTQRFDFLPPPPPFPPI